ncbi:hypothetical protein KY331_04050 [Candidatus Woesearchaeota archaeon]|nr:hypothetical protein [Candidatus Woesearchaeota archaeon]
MKLNKNDMKKGLKLPKEISCDLAELVGIHFGDGYMQNKHNSTYRLEYNFNIRDKKYADYVFSLFYKLFNIRLRLIHNNKKNVATLYFYSKTLCGFFNNVLKIPYSPKKDLSIPLYIKTNKKYLKCFLRGLFDTDGCMTLQKDGKYKYKLIKICTGINNFAEEIKLAFAFLGIKSYITRKKQGYDITIREKRSFNEFIDSIKPKNIKE